MPANLGAQIATLVGVGTLLGMLWGLRSVYKTHMREERERWEHDQYIEEASRQHREWLELLIVDYARHTGYSLPKELIERHMRINGNANMPAAEKDRLYGKNRPKSDPHQKSARAMGLVDEDK